MMRVQAGDLEVAFEMFGAESAPAVLLIHGWPDDASTWKRVGPALADQGFGVIVPTLRGFGETRFLRQDMPRTGNSGVLAMDMIALLDALDIQRCSVVGHDWGSNTAEAMAVGWPDRIERIAMMSTPPRLGGMRTPPFWHAQREWYHWFMATERGAAAVRKDRRTFTQLHWENWSPHGWFNEATFDAVAASFENPDWADVTIHSYRSRWDEALPDARSQWLEAKVKEAKTLSLPALYIHGLADGVNPPATAEKVPDKFAGPFELLAIDDVGHFPQREAPDQVVEAILRLLRR